jgi:hypothetical protein
VSHEYICFRFAIVLDYLISSAVTFPMILHQLPLTQYDSDEEKINKIVPVKTGLRQELMYGAYFTSTPSSKNCY